jgi:hypothetical protein
MRPVKIVLVNGVPGSRKFAPWLGYLVRVQVVFRHLL